MCVCECVGMSVYYTQQDIISIAPSIVSVLLDAAWHQGFDLCPIARAGKALTQGLAKGGLAAEVAKETVKQRWRDSAGGKGWLKMGKRKSYGCINH